MTVMPLDRVLRCDRVVLEPILDFDVGSIPFDPVRGVCLFRPVIPWDTTRTLCLHWGGRGGGGGVFVTSHIRYGRNFLTLYKYGLLST